MLRTARLFIARPPVLGPPACSWAARLFLARPRSALPDPAKRGFRLIRWLCERGLMLAVAPVSAWTVEVLAMAARDADHCTIVLRQVGRVGGGADMAAHALVMGNALISVR
jgi:hypothetical protein